MYHNRQAKTVAVLLAATGAFAWYALVPAERRLQSARAEADQILGQIGEQSQQVLTLRQLHDEVQRLEQRVRDFRTRIPPEHELGVFLKELAAILERNGFAHYTLQPQPARPLAEGRLPADLLKAMPGLHTQPVVVQVAGDFDALFSALRELEQTPRLSQVESLSLEAREDHRGEIRVEILVHTFFLAESAGTGK